ncbi:HopJ type III effector protein [Emticicia oligotrophica DSM 17448]|uniref:HopJ type III effector protein n=1 Tax=Emticicia oligotrophica (strain DSM 17448 / CIP 109782 / MTCC 6937 / GPTSA100-15) TaxID=929562 RepID=A0ABM5MXY3_EMTOG|nr:HopJ type III effector protein [Emticicia oligotrophica]AFK02010.1 HopJ type III effector protein [Emticicia oligotrophica DSM 17448]
MTLEEFLKKLKETPQEVAFTDTMAVVEANYDFTPTAFQNGDLSNEAGQNSGSCKLFSFAKIQGFSVEDTLACFGDFYRKDVLENPEASNHQNIRNFMKTGWAGISFEGTALTEKK